MFFYILYASMIYYFILFENWTSVYGSHEFKYSSFSLRESEKVMNKHLVNNYHSRYFSRTIVFLGGTV